MGEECDVSDFIAPARHLDDSANLNLVHNLNEMNNVNNMNKLKNVRAPSVANVNEKRNIDKMNVGVGLYDVDNKKTELLGKRNALQVPPIRKTNSLNNNNIGVDYGNNDDYEPKFIGVENPKIPVGPRRPRARYASTELGIRERLLVAVLSSIETIESLAVAVNRTSSHHVPKLVFFMNGKGPSLPPGMSVVIFSDDKQHYLPFHTLKYIGEHYRTSYDWFFLAKDTTYLRTKNILELISHTSMAQKVYAGKPVKSSDGSTMNCRFENGILLSQVLFFFKFFFSDLLADLRSI